MIRPGRHVHARLACAWLLVLAAACSPPSDDAQRSDTQAADPALAALPDVDSAALAPDARSRLETARGELASRLGGARDDAARAAAWGRFAELTHAYGLLQLAVPAYERALELAPAADRDALAAHDADPWRWRYLVATVDQDAGRLGVAADRLGALLDERPDDVAARVRLAEIQLANGRTEEAAVAFRQLLDAGVAEASAHFGLGRIASAAGRHQESIDHWLRVLELQPGAKNVHALLAAAYRRAGDDAAAQFHSTQIGTGFVSFDDPVLESVQQLATGTGALIEDARIAVESEAWQHALDLYEQALAIDPANAAALGGKAFMHRMLRNPEAAEATYRTLLELDPDDHLTRLELATLLSESPPEATDELEEALAQLGRVLEKQPDFEQAHTNLGVAYAKLGRWPQALAAFERSLELDPDDPRTRYRYAVTLDSAGRPADAIAALRSLVADVPTHVPAHQHLGALLEQAGDLEGAAANYRRVLEIEGTPPEEQALAHYQLGRLASTAAGPTFDSDAAFAHFESAVALFPGLWQARFALGRRLAESGRWQEAAEHYGAVVAERPGQVEARTLEAEARMHAGQWQRAGEVLARGLETAPKSAQLGHLMARLLALAPEGIGDPARALPLAQSVFEAQPSNLHTETVVMALAAQGRFDEAVQWQERLVAKSESEGDIELLPRLRANLDRYRQRLAPTLGR